MTKIYYKNLSKNKYRSFIRQKIKKEFCVSFFAELSNEVFRLSGGKSS